MERLKEVRKLRGVTQEVLADHLRCGKATVSRYETGEREPDLETLNKIADFLEVSVDYLLGRTDPPSPSVVDELDGVQFAFGDGAAQDIAGEIFQMSEKRRRDLLKIIRIMKEEDE